MSDRAIRLVLALLVGSRAGIAQADSGNVVGQTRVDLISPANAPRSSLFQIRRQNPYAPAFGGPLRLQGNFLYYLVVRLWMVREIRTADILDGRQTMYRLLVDISLGHILQIYAQYLNCFLESAWNVRIDSRRSAITFGFLVLYPKFCGTEAGL